MGKNKYGGICNVTNVDKRTYELWYQMLRRCYDEKQLERNKGKSYVNCTVCERWFDYSNFATDIITLPGYENWLNQSCYCLDKDTINPGNKIYSKEYCCFIPSTENVRDIHKRNPQNIEKLHELNKTKYILTKDDEVLVFNSEKEACEYVGVVKCSVASCYRRGTKCKGYMVSKMDGDIT